MSYLVLARKWRPARFSDVVGQEHVIRALVNALDSERLHHALLFTGTRGIGKTTIARIYAKALNCERGIGAHPCNECSSCEEINEGRFVDLLEVDAASRTKVDETRELLDNVPYAPARGRYKVYLIDEVHMLSKHSFNALLKTLEEPPPHVQFLLATTDPESLPATVLSRCLQFNLKRLPPDLIQQRLAKIAEEENIGFEPAALKLLARSAEGSLRDALSLLDQLIAFGGEKLSEEAAREMLGTVNLDFIGRLLEALAAGDGESLLGQIAAMDEHVPDYRSVLRELARVFQRMAIVRSVPAATEGDDESEAIAALAQKFTEEDLQLNYQIAIIAARDLDLAPDYRSGFEMALLRMMAFRPAEIAAESGSDDRTSHADNKAASNSPQKATEPRANAAVDWTSPDWTAMVADLEVQGLARQLAEHTVYDAREGVTIRLRLDATYEHLLTPRSVSQLESALSAGNDEILKLDVQIGDSVGMTPAGHQSREETRRAAAARESIDQDPGVKALKEVFDAQVDPDSVKPIDGGAH